MQVFGEIYKKNTRKLHHWARSPPESIPWKKDSADARVHPDGVPYIPSPIYDIIIEIIREFYDNDYPRIDEIIRESDEIIRESKFVDNLRNSRIISDSRIISSDSRIISSIRG